MRCHFGADACRHGVVVVGCGIDDQQPTPAVAQHHRQSIWLILGPEGPAPAQAAPLIGRGDHAHARRLRPSTEHAQQQQQPVAGSGATVDGLEDHALVVDADAAMHAVAEHQQHDQQRQQHQPQTDSAECQPDHADGLVFAARQEHQTEHAGTDGAGQRKHLHQRPGDHPVVQQGNLDLPDQGICGGAMICHGDHLASRESAAI